MAPQLESGIHALNISGVPGVTLPRPFPHHQNRLDADDKVLKQHGFPPKPDKSTKEYAAWAHTVSRALNFVQPTFTQLPICKEAAYSGATNVPLKEPTVDNYKFTQVTGSWTVPRPTPQNWAFKECGWTPAEFFANTWIGIDDDRFRAGLAQDCITYSHQDTEYIVYPWYQFSRDGEVYKERIHGLVVRPGDLVRVYIRRDAGSIQSVVSFFNESAATYSSIFIDNVDFKGEKAFWIVEDPCPKSADPTLSYLGATNFFDCTTNQAGKDGMGEPAYARGNLYGATVSDIVAEGGTVSTTRLRKTEYQQDADILTITSEVREPKIKVEG
ncbi:hypothetical protein EG329_004098 [Mollisiaceae sp. DMI_Dod_QoI]|nr:hypothetical protein EG329_004098 [Helotiales sp. DMI_Dod_QoI]